ncbi:MAG: chloride channel protein [Kofleriaceae bacterium]
MTDAPAPPPASAVATDAPLRTVVAWIVVAAAVGVACGGASALFLWSLEQVTGLRTSHPHLVFALPAAGLVIGLAYARFGAPIRAGNSLVIDTIHDDGPEVPLRMWPMVLGGTLATHLFGGSAGREGTAVQMGASMADFVAHRARLSRTLRRHLLIAGVAGGFGSVFGTPLAGAVFAMEFVVLGRLQYQALIPALVASVVGDLTTRGLGITHTAFPEVSHLDLSPTVVAAWLAFALAVAAACVVFIELTHGLARLGTRALPWAPARLAVGGAIVVAMWQLVGTDAYLGLGVPTIVRAFSDPDLPTWAFAAKLAFTAVTLGAGFIGGEVTPLFFIGAALGGVLAPALGLPRDLGAGVGMAAVFAAAANAPLALSIMAVELLGVQVLPHVAIVCAVAYVAAGHRGIYGSQRLVRGKLGGRRAAPSRLAELRRRVG